MKKILLVFVSVLALVILAVLVYFTTGSEVTSRLDSYIYDLPYQKGKKYKVVLGYGGRFSHTNKAALDFSMPEGTPIYAARGGTVYGYKDHFKDGGPFSKYNSKANYIVIRHDDGSYGCYWHLRHKGVKVKKGSVKRGQLIGFSGKTGFVLRPHLHFAVKRILSYDKDAFVQTKFNTSVGIKILRRGNSYENPVLKVAGQE